MGQITTVIDDDVEKELRDRCSKKGDMGREISDALRTVYLMKVPKDKKKRKKRKKRKKNK